MSDKIKEYLIYTGIYGSVISALAYLVTTYVIVTGFQTSIDTEKQLLFSILGALVGLMITALLRAQGITFAKKEPKNMEIMKAYVDAKNKNRKTKKYRTIGWYILWATLKDIFIKGSSIGISTWFVLYIFMDGNGDYSLFLLAISNIFMFAGFGLVAMSKSYDRYNDEHIPAIIAITNDLIMDQSGSVRSKE